MKVCHLAITTNYHLLGLQNQKFKVKKLYRKRYKFLCILNYIILFMFLNSAIYLLLQVNNLEAIII